MVVKNKVCKNCGFLTTEDVCPNCGSKEFLDKYKGEVLILDFKRSEIAKKLGITSNGKFAIKY